MARTIPVWLHANDEFTSDTARVELESRGAFVPQAAAETEVDRWLTLVRSAGSGSPPSNFNYLGGDVTDGFVTSGGDIVWVGADWFDGTTVDPDDTYTGAALPVRNGALIETTDGVFASQLYAAGSSGPFLDAIASGGLAVGTHWWPICALNDGGTNKILCWHVNGLAPTPYGTLLDSHIVSLTAFGTYASHVATGLGASDRFWIDGVLRDASSGFTYVYGEQFVPDYDANDGGGQPNYGQGDLASSYTLKRVARVPNGQLGTVANWTFWNGTTWVPGVSNAVPLVDTTGAEIRGDAGVRRVGADHWVLAAHQLVDTHVAVYRASAPQGPWTPTYRVPAPTQGETFNGGTQIGQLTKVLGFAPPAVPAGHSLVLLSRNLLNPVDPFSARNIRRYAPQFIVVPNA